MSADAQITMTYAVDSPQLAFIWQNTDKFEVLDSAYLTVTYSLHYRSSETDDSLSYEDLMDLQMGRKYNAFFSRNLRETDTKNTESINTHMYFVIHRIRPPARPRGRHPDGDEPSPVHHGGNRI